MKLAVAMLKYTPSEGFSAANAGAYFVQVEKRAIRALAASRLAIPWRPLERLGQSEKSQAPSNGAGEARVLMIDASSRVMKAKRPLGAHVCFTPNSGVRADIPGAPLWAKALNRCAITR